MVQGFFNVRVEAYNRVDNYRCETILAAERLADWAISAMSNCHVTVNCGMETVSNVEMRGGERVDLMKRD